MHKPKKNLPTFAITALIKTYNISLATIIDKIAKMKPNYAIPLLVWNLLKIIDWFGTIGLFYAFVIY